VQATSVKWDHMKVCFVNLELKKTSCSKEFSFVNELSPVKKISVKSQKIVRLST
jgi:hypothetical protein